MERRDVLKGAAGAGGALTIGGIGLLFMPPRVAATGGYGTAEADTDDGQVNYVAIYGQSRVDWSGFDEEATQFRIQVAAHVEDSDDEVVAGPQQIHDTGPISLENDDWGGAGEDHSGPGTSGYIESDIGYNDDGELDGDLFWDVLAPNGDPTQGHNEYELPEDPLPSEEVPRVEEDDSSETFTVVIESTYTWYDSGGNHVFDESWEGTVDLTVTNKEAKAEADSTGTGATAG